jgi:membrane-bound lytic murein transglycosylase MltF
MNFLKEYFFKTMLKKIKADYLKDLEDRGFIVGDTVKIRLDNIKEDLYHYMKRAYGLQMSYQKFCEIADKENEYGPKSDTLSGPDIKKG